MNITLDLLNNIQACKEAKLAFIEKFGEQGTPTARDVFVALAASNRSDWLFWLAAIVDGFTEAVGNFSHNKFTCAMNGKIATQAYALLSDNARAELHGNASAVLHGNARAVLHGNARAELYNNASAVLHGNARAELHNNARAVLYGNASTVLYGNASTVLYGNARAELYNNASAVFHDNARAELHGNASAELYDSASALIFNVDWCAGVKFIFRSRLACVVDWRGDGFPKLVTLDHAI